MRLLRYVFAATSLCLTLDVLAQGWPGADCSNLLASGHPRPAWGSKEKVTQEGLLMMINYQMAVSACQQDEVIKLLKNQTTTKPYDAPKAKPAEIAKFSKPDEVFPRLEAIPKTSDAAESPKP